MTSDRSRSSWDKTLAMACISQNFSVTLRISDDDSSGEPNLRCNPKRKNIYTYIYMGVSKNRGNVNIRLINPL